MYNMGNYYYNDNSKQYLTEQILYTIRYAVRYIKISSFLMQDKEIVDELCKASESGRAAVFVISNRNQKEGEEYKATTNANTKAQEGINNHQRFLQDLYYSGVHVRLLDNLHAKFIIADGKNGLLMSANISPNSLSGNVESGVTLGVEEISDLEIVFDTMFNYADIVQFISGQNHDVVKFSNRKMPNSSFSNLKSNIRLTVRSKSDTNLSECNETSLYKTIIDIINEAKSFVYIVSWEFKDRLGKLQTFYNAINRAIKRGVKITLFYNSKGPEHNIRVQEEFIVKMGSIGCDAYFDQSNHSKCILSENRGFLFTANIDGNAGLLEGFEVGCIMDENQHKQAIEHVEQLINKAKKQDKYERR